VVKYELFIATITPSRNPEAAMNKRFMIGKLPRLHYISFNQITAKQK